MSRLVLSAALAAIMLLPTAAAPAPAPFQRTKRDEKLNVVGDWLMTWHSTAYIVSLSPDGRYQAVNKNLAEAFGPGGGVWYGTWRLEGRTFHVKEGTCPHGEPTCAWSVALDRDLSGSLNGGEVNFRLKR